MLDERHKALANICSFNENTTMSRFALCWLLATSIHFSFAQNCCDEDNVLDLCYLSGADYCGSNFGSCFEYSLDGQFMANSLATKLTSTNNFGPNGTVNCSFELKKLEDVSSVEAINDCGCDLVFVPSVFVGPNGNSTNLEQTFIPEPIMQNIYDWSVACDNNLVVLTQNEANLWGYVTTNSNVNPNTPVLGTSINSIFEGPFGSLDFFNQGGSYQGVFTTTPSTGFEILAYDANQNITAALDAVTKDIVVGDIGIFCSFAGEVTEGPEINNNNDILVCNMFALACELTQEGERVTVAEELCPGELFTLPDGEIVNTAGIYIDTIPTFNGCDSIITTAIAIGIADDAIFTQPDTTICNGDTLTIDGRFSGEIPIPFFENASDILINPTFVPITSDIPITGFGDLTLEEGMIQSICIDIEHARLSDLDVILVAPNGEILELSTDNGSNGDNYSGTCFTEDAIQVIGSLGTSAPFSGEFLPEGDWGEIYGTLINGNWQLIIKDDSNGVVGTLLGWSITFTPFLEITYEWQENEALSCDDCPITELIPNVTNTYFLTLTDSYGCSATDSLTVEVWPLLPAPELSCEGITVDSIIVNWGDLNGANGYEINIAGSGWEAPNNGDLGHIISGLLPLDTLEIFVRAFDNCEGIISAITCSTPICNAPTLSLVSTTPASCSGGSDGAIALAATGGSGAGYVYELDGVLSNNGIFDNLQAGIYEVVVTDDEACAVTISVSVTEPDAILLNPEIASPISCFGGSDGILRVGVESGGVAPFSYFWNGEERMSTLTEVTAGSYEIVVFDANDCFTIDTIDLNEPAPLEAEIDLLSVDCYGNDTGAATILPQGGTSPYLYQWSTSANNQTGATISNLTAGVYVVTVTDANDCTLISEIPVTQPEEVNLNIIPQNQIELGASISLNLMVNLNENQIDTIIWTPTDNLSCTNCLDPIANPLFSTQYMVQLVDENGCFLEASTLVIVDKEVPIFVPNIFSPNGDGSNDLLSVFSSEQKVLAVKSFQVFDRWGANVFVSENFPPNDLSAGWDGTFNGKEMNSGVYVWIAEVELLDGRTEVIEGDVDLVR